MRVTPTFAVILALQLGCASTTLREPLPADSLRLELEIQEARVNRSTRPVANLKIENAASSPVAFSETFGVTNRPWLSFEIRTADGQAIYYPTEIDVFGEIPSYMCLQPGEIVELRIDLLSWRPIFGGEFSGEEYAFDLSPGHYRLQARYSDNPERARSAVCPGIDGTSTSEWVTFELGDFPAN